jgi:hypothetical protein
MQSIILINEYHNNTESIVNFVHQDNDLSTF